VRIVDLARNMIRLSGHEPDTEIAVEIIGRRPGEKLHEELFNADERPQPTAADKILAAGRSPLDSEWVEEAFVRIESLTYGEEPTGIAAAVATLAREREELALAPATGAQSGAERAPVEGVDDGAAAGMQTQAGDGPLSG
jgi:FlaA1/EpsC-like NDP-sugar epimerase